MASTLSEDLVYYDSGGTILQETEEAILLDVDGEEVWLPKSQIEYDGDKGDYVEIEIPPWLCKQKGLEDGIRVNKPESQTEIQDNTESPKPAFDPEELLEFELFISDELEDGNVMVEVEGKEPFELSKEDILTGDTIEAGETITCQIKAGVALKADLIESPVKALGGNCTWLRKDKLYHEFPLSDKDRIELAVKMAEAQGKIDKLEEELAETRKALKGKIDVLQGDLKEHARILRVGESEPGPVTWDVIKDWDTEELVWVSADEEHLELQRRKMTP